MARKVTTADVKLAADELEAYQAKLQKERSDRLPNEGQKKQPDGHRAKARLVVE